MNLILDLFTKRELMIIGVVIGFLILIVLIVTLISVLARRKKENAELEEAFETLNEINVEPIKKIDNLNEINNIKEDVKEEINIQSSYQELDNNYTLKNDEEKSEVIEIKKIDNNYIEPIIIDVDEVQESKVNNMETNLNINPPIQENLNMDLKKQAQLELNKIVEDLQNPKSLEDTLYDLEIKEEQDAIISYQELLENTRELNKVNIDSGDEIISLKEIVNIYNSDDNVSLTTDVDSEMSKVSLDDAYKGQFTSTPLISPIMGFEQENLNMIDLAEIQLENTANLEKLDKELRKTNEFLKVLNELKKNLD